MSTADRKHFSRIVTRFIKLPPRNKRVLEVLVERERSAREGKRESRIAVSVWRNRCIYLAGLRGKPLRAAFITSAFSLYSLYVPRAFALAQASDRVSKKEAFLSDSIFASGIGNKSEARYRERDQRVRLKIISNRGTFIASRTIHGAKSCQRFYGQTRTSRLPRKVAFEYLGS